MAVFAFPLADTQIQDYRGDKRPDSDARVLAHR